MTPYQQLLHSFSSVQNEFKSQHEDACNFASGIVPAFTDFMKPPEGTVFMVQPVQGQMQKVSEVQQAVFLRPDMHWGMIIALQILEEKDKPLQTILVNIMFHKHENGEYEIHTEANEDVFLVKDSSLASLTPFFQDLLKDILLGMQQQSDSLGNTESAKMRRIGFK